MPGVDASHPHQWMWTALHRQPPGVRQLTCWVHLPPALMMWVRALELVLVWEVLELVWGQVPA